MGYSLQQADVIERLQLIEKHQAGMVLAAVGENGRVLGWLHVAPHYSLGAPPQAQILALVVDVQARGASIGTTLMGAAEVWARGHNLGEMQVSSSLVREDADHFYCGRGYHHLREQQLFRKTLEEMRY